MTTEPVETTGTNAGAAAPTVEDFLKARGFGSPAPLKEFVISLQENQPTMVPPSLQKDRSQKSLRSGLYAAARRLEPSIRVKTKIQSDGSLWIMRLEDRGEPPASARV